MSVHKVDNRNDCGYLGASVYYDKKAEQRYESRIWKCLLGVAMLVLAFTLWLHIREVQVIHNGSMIECAYYVDDRGVGNASYYDEEDRLYTFKFTGQKFVHSDDSVEMYYVGNISDAIPKTSIMVWIGYYAFFGILAAICIWRIKVIYSK